jgi:hypothetical protein
MYQQRQNPNSNSVSTSYASSEPQSEAPHKSGELQSGHQIQRAHSNQHPHLNLIGKLPEERERYWNNIRIKNIDKFKTQSMKTFLL